MGEGEVILRFVKFRVSIVLNIGFILKYLMVFKRGGL